MPANILEKKENLEEITNLNNANLDSLETNQTAQSEKEEGGLIGILGECLTFAPLLYERFTKKKLPPMGGTLGDMSQSIQQLATGFQQLSNSLVTIVSNQNKIFNRIAVLENNASKQILSLDRRIENFASLKLTHEKERKQIEYNPKQLEDNEAYE